MGAPIGDSALEAIDRKVDGMYKVAVYFNDKTENYDDVMYSVHVPQLHVTGEGPTLDEAVSDARSKATSSMLTSLYYHVAIPAPYSDSQFRADLRKLEEMPWEWEVLEKVGELEVGVNLSEAEMAAELTSAAAEEKTTGVRPLF